ncbi:MAG: EVE domain-containing protein [Chitinophagaceae bacterium]|nr:EVE domain-containing protein [Chitinophagaceae bacterium]
MNYWLIKSEPNTYSFEQLLKDKKTCWDGVRNYAARNNLRAMQKGDQLLYYHSMEGLEIVGIAEVVKTAYQDPKTDDPNWVAVDVKALKKLKQPVTLAAIKENKKLAEMQLVRISRLSVSAVTPEEFQIILAMSEKK